MPFDELKARGTLLTDLFGDGIPASLSILPPCCYDYRPGASLGERVFINQGCFLPAYGGIILGDRVLTGPRVALNTAGHPVELRFALRALRVDPAPTRRCPRTRQHRPKTLSTKG